MVAKFSPGAVDRPHSGGLCIFTGPIPYKSVSLPQKRRRFRASSKCGIVTANSALAIETVVNAKKDGKSGDEGLLFDYRLQSQYWKQRMDLKYMP